MLIEAKGSAFADMKGIFSSNCIEYINAWRGTVNKLLFGLKMHITKFNIL